MSEFLEGTHVTIVNLGPSYQDREFRGIIKGLAIDGPARIWIVEMVDELAPAVYSYSHCTMPEACLRFGWSGENR